MMIRFPVYVLLVSEAAALSQLDGWRRGTVVDRRSVTSKLSLSYARPAADGRPLMWVNRPLQVSHLG